MKSLKNVFEDSQGASKITASNISIEANIVDPHQTAPTGPWNERPMS